jgi:photosystem II stability/assembly factor-like uncharacterized protein
MRWQIVPCLVLSIGAAANAQTPCPPEALSDAELTSVCFVDADLGWAVGEHGVIWHTIDGGRNWQRQESPTRVRLESVWFHDAEAGWAVGGFHQPYTRQSVGVVLRTVDGGNTWQQVQGLNLPALKKVKFFGARQGVAIGESSAMYPGGVFFTADGGRSWSTLTLAKSPQAGSLEGWSCGDFSSVQSGIVASSHMLGTIEGTELRRQPSAVQPKGLRISRQGQSWLCGDGGQLLAASAEQPEFTTPRTWPHDVARWFDLAAVATNGPHAWVAGSPGTVVFHSPDAGATWEMQPTDHRTPLNALQFVDENRGWAVGAFGAILATRDGGRSWRVQRSGGTRAALLAAYSQFERVPHEVIVQQAGNEAYLTVIDVLTRPAGERSYAERIRSGGAALLASSTEVSDRFPLPAWLSGASAEQLLAEWNKTHNGAAVAALERDLVRSLRMWRPDVVLTENAHPGGDDPLAHLMNQFVLSAVAKAGDSDAFPDLTTHARLPAWKVKKVIASHGADQQGDIKVISAQLAPRIGASLADVADEARGQYERDPQVAPAARGLSILLDTLPQGQGRRDLFSGIALTAGGEARRYLSNPPGGDLAHLSKQIQKRQLLQGLLERSERDALRGQAWLAQITDMTRGLTPNASSRIMYHLAKRYQASGEQELAAEVMTLLLEKHAEHPLADAAALWLLQYQISGETAHRARHQAQAVVPAVTVTEPAKEAVRPAAGQGAGSRSTIAPASASEPIASAGRLEKALALGKLLDKNRPTLSAEPEVRFLLANARRRSSQASGDGENLLQAIAASADDHWAACAQAELWLATKQTTRCPRPLLACKSTEAKPKLDGRLDDAAWQAARPVALRTLQPEQSSAATVALVYDEEFLYLAISSERALGGSYAADSRVRPRDADLSSHDRVDLLLDLDRDYLTSYRFTVDHRGWTSEACCGDSTWNPAWFVAASGDETHWTIEAAIPMAELTADKSLKKQCWAVGLMRTLPNAGTAGWSSTENVVECPQVMGLMRFE